MIPYDNPEQTLITFMGTQYKAKPPIPKAINACVGCAFKDPVVRLLFDRPCSQLPCNSHLRRDRKEVIFVEVSDDSL